MPSWTWNLSCLDARGFWLDDCLVLVINQDRFIDEVLVLVPDIAATILAHHDRPDRESLLQLLIYDLERITAQAIKEGNEREESRLLAFVDRCKRYGDEQVKNAVASSSFAWFPGDEMP